MASVCGIVKVCHQISGTAVAILHRKQHRRAPLGAAPGLAAARATDQRYLERGYILIVRCDARHLQMDVGIWRGPELHARHRGPICGARTLLPPAPGDRPGWSRLPRLDPAPPAKGRVARHPRRSGPATASPLGNPPVTSNRSIVGQLSRAGSDRVVAPGSACKAGSPVRRSGTK